jgi:type I restriction enzyme M protein
MRSPLGTCREFSSHDLATLYGRAHDLMRNIDALQPQEAFDELLKYLYFKESLEAENGTLFEKRVSTSDGGFASGVATSARALFARQVRESKSPAAREVWKEGTFQLSDAALTALDELMRDVSFRSLDIDVRSAAFREFLPAEIRRGLGIYLTPDGIVRMAVEIVNPEKGARVYDPACGSGTSSKRSAAGETRALRCAVLLRFSAPTRARGWCYSRS